MNISLKLSVLAGFIDTIVSVIETHLKDVVTLMMSDNNIDTLLLWGRLSSVLPNLLNLDISNNALMVCE